MNLGSCAGEIASNTINVTVFDSPTQAPVAENITAAAGEVELTATGNNLIWFSDSNGDIVLGEGSPLVVDVNANTMVYVASQEIYGEVVTENGGKEDISTFAGQHHFNSQNGLVFTAFQDMIIKDVKVDADGQGNRTIQVFNSDGSLLTSEVFDIPDGESIVELNFLIPAGEDYVIITGDDNPQLWRDDNNADVNYPYELGDLGAITGTTINGQNEFTYYYFFYDWNVESAPVKCLSEIVPVSITISGIDELEGISAFNLYPNPASGEIYYEYTAIKTGDVMMSLTDISGKEVFSQTLDSTVGSHNGVIGLNEFAPGVYTFTLVEGNKLATEKIVIE